MRSIKLSYSIAVLTTLAGLSVGCDPTPPPAPKLLPAHGPSSSYASTQPDDVVAELSTLTVTRKNLDQLLYEAYGLRMLFDIVELDLAKTTLKAQGQTMNPQDIQAERKRILAGIRGDAGEEDTENLFKQFLQQQHITRAEFDLKVVQTDAYLRKIVSPEIVGKLHDDTLRRGFEQIYGAKRQIADIEVENVREATIARDRLKTESFQKVALSMSIDGQTKANGGLWQPFSMQSGWAPQVIRDTAFSMDKGQISDIISDNSKFHVITVVNIIQPQLVKFEDVKDSVRKQLEEELITVNMKQLRERLSAQAQHDLQFDDPVLKAQWDALVEQQTAKNDRESIRKQMKSEQPRSATTAASTQP